MSIGGASRSVATSAANGFHKIYVPLVDGPLDELVDGAVSVQVRGLKILVS